MGRGNSELSNSGTDVLAKDAAMSKSHPNDAVAPTPTKIAIGAARAAPDTSSEMCAAESSGHQILVNKSR